MTNETHETLEAVEDFTDKLLANKRTRITQYMIYDYLSHKHNVETLRRKLKETEQVLELYTNAYVKILGHARQEPGDLRMELDVTERQAAVKWKEEFAKVAGPKAVEQAQADAGKSRITKIVIVSANPQNCGQTS